MCRPGKSQDVSMQTVNFINVFPLYERKLLIHYQKLLNWVPNICIIHLYNMCPALLISALTLLLYLMNISNIRAHKSQAHNLANSQAHMNSNERCDLSRQSSLWLICYVNINIAQTQYGRRPRQAGMEDQDVRDVPPPAPLPCHGHTLNYMEMLSQSFLSLWRQSAICQCDCPRVPTGAPPLAPGCRKVIN